MAPIDVLVDGQISGVDGRRSVRSLSERVRYVAVPGTGPPGTGATAAGETRTETARRNQRVPPGDRHLVLASLIDTIREFNQRSMGKSR